MSTRRPAPPRPLAPPRRPAALLAVRLAACGGAGDGAAQRSAADNGSAADDGTAAGGRGGPWFVDAAASSGLDFHHFNGGSGRFHMVEILGSGGGLLDYDGDGDLDAYLVQGAMLDADRTLDEAVFPLRHPAPPSDRLYRNDLAVRWVLRQPQA